MTGEDQNASSSSYFDQNYMQDRKVYIENERFNMNPEPGELFSYVDNGPIFGAQGWAPPPPVLNGPPPQSTIYFYFWMALATLEILGCIS